MIVLSLIAVCAAPAEACLWKPPSKQAFWPDLPYALAPGEIALELELVAPAREIFDLPAFATSCTGLTPVVVYNVRKVVIGKFVGSTVVLAPLFNMSDENWSPLTHRLVVGRLTPARKFAVDADLSAHHPINAPVLDIRPLSDRERSAWDVVEYVVLGLSGLAYRQVALLAGADHVDGSSAWAGIVFVVMLALGAAWLVWRMRGRHQRS